ncbi:MAG: hypothetical protein J2P18_12280 [Nocardia sp.]|nr:hypothetical protein [Nocardia sp.]
MQYRPTATQLLDAVAQTLDEELLPELPDRLRHTARVAAHLVRMVGREVELGPQAAAREAELVSEVDGPGDLDWEALAEIVRADLSICKPGYDRWEGR